jgi:hypothetical protein
MRQKYVDHLVACVGDQIKLLLLTVESRCKVDGPPFSIDSKEVDLLYGRYFNIQQLSHVPCKNIPKHLVKKGYAEMTESTYLISGEKN